MNFPAAILLSGAVLAAIPPSAVAATNELGWSLDSALTQLDRQTKDFQSALADVDARWVNSSGETTREASGRIYINRDGTFRIDVSAPEARVLLTTSSKVSDYDPTRALVEEYALRKHPDRLEPFVRLGFTDAGKGLRDDYVLTLIGEEQIGQQRALGLELTPTRNDIREKVSRIRLWIDEASWMPVRLIIEHVTTGEELTVSFSGMARNLKLNPDLFKARWPKGTQTLER